MRSTLRSSSTFVADGLAHHVQEVVPAITPKRQRYVAGMERTFVPGVGDTVIQLKFFNRERKELTQPLNGVPGLVLNRGSSGEAWG